MIPMKTMYTIVREAYLEFEDLNRIEFSNLGKLYIDPRMVLGYFISILSN